MNTDKILNEIKAILDDVLVSDKQKEYLVPYINILQTIKDKKLAIDGHSLFVYRRMLQSFKEGIKYEQQSN